MTKFNLDHQDTFMKVLKEIIPNVGHITNNTTNTNSNNNINNNFNIQMFLNDKCKNAYEFNRFYRNSYLLLVQHMITQLKTD